MEELGLFDLRITGLLIVDPNTGDLIDVRAAKNTGEPINIIFGMTSNTTHDEARMIGNAIKDYTQSIERLVLCYRLDLPNAPNAEQRLQIITSFASQMEGANTNINVLHLDFGRGDGVAGIEEAVVTQSNRELAALGPLIESNSTITGFQLTSNANAHGIRAFVNFFASAFRFRSLKTIYFQGCPNFGDDAVQSLVQLSHETNQTWLQVYLAGLPIGNAGIGALVNGLKTERLHLSQINIDDTGAEIISTALLSTWTRSLRIMIIKKCPSMTARGASMIYHSVFNDITLQSLSQCNHTLCALVVEGKDFEIDFNLAEFLHRLRDPPRLANLVRVGGDFSRTIEIVKAVVYLKDNFKPSDVESIPLELLPRLLNVLDRLGELELIFRIIRSKDPVEWISE